MELFGMPIVQVYLVVLIIAGLATLLYIFFSDMAEGIGEVSPFLDPAVVLAFITFVAAVAVIYWNLLQHGIAESFWSLHLSLHLYSIFCFISLSFFH